jgi:hypothetical protein
MGSALLPTYIKISVASHDLLLLLCIDLDLGEMFLNFTLDERLQPYAGVAITC